MKAKYFPVSKDSKPFDSLTYSTIDEFAMVPRAEAKLNAGNGNVVLSEEIGKHYAFRNDWLKTIGSSRNNVLLMDVDGDSMSPTIANAALF